MNHLLRLALLLVVEMLLQCNTSIAASSSPATTVAPASAPAPAHANAETAATAAEGMAVDAAPARVAARLVTLMLVEGDTADIAASVVPAPNATVAVAVADADAEVMAADAVPADDAVSSATRLLEAKLLLRPRYPLGLQQILQLLV